MRRSRQLVQRGWALGIAALTAISLAQAGFAEQPLEQLPEDVVSFSLARVALPQMMVEVTKDHGPLAGASWGVIKGSSAVVERVTGLMDGETADRDERHSPAWLNLNNAGSRQPRHEPALLRYTF